MKSVIDIFDELESDNSRLFKEDVLEQHRKNLLLKSVFVAAFDPYVNYYVSKFKMPPSIPHGMSDDDAVEAFLKFIKESLSTRKVTGNAAKDAVVDFFSRLTDGQQKWCLRILLKNLRCGVQETTVNKVWPGSITKFSVQLAETLSSHFEKDKGIVIDEPVKYPVRIEPKLDGLRCIAVKHGGEVTMFTRNGTVIDSPGIQMIKKVLENAAWDNFVLDGELLDEDGTWNSTASGVLKKK